MDCKCLKHAVCFYILVFHLLIGDLNIIYLEQMGNYQTYAAMLVLWSVFFFTLQGSAQVTGLKNMN